MEGRRERSEGLSSGARAKLSLKFDLLVLLLNCSFPINFVHHPLSFTFFFPVHSFSFDLIPQGKETSRTRSVKPKFKSLLCSSLSSLWNPQIVTFFSFQVLTKLPITLFYSHTLFSFKSSPSLQLASLSFGRFNLVIFDSESLPFQEGRILNLNSQHSNQFLISSWHQLLNQP